MALKLLRTIRLDASDTFVFERAADPGEWAVPGSFQFWDVDPAALEGKRRQAFRAGFLGLGSFGFSTLAIVTAATEEEREAAVEALARHLVGVHGAPSLAVARAAAEEEIAFSASLSDHPTETLVAMHRTVEAGEIRERFRTLRPGRKADPNFQNANFRAFEFLEVEGEDEIEEHVDLMSLGRAE